MSDIKINLLNILREHKDILFGKFTATLTHQIKIAKWKEITEQAHALCALDVNKDWRYLRNTLWQNWRKRAIVSQF